MYARHTFGDPIVTCPYNRSHRISQSRIQSHIVKCEKNYPVGFLEICPYNATHRFFKHQMPEHIDKCSKSMSSEFQPVRNHGSTMSHASWDTDHEEDEVWDDEGDSSSRDSSSHDVASSLTYRRLKVPLRSKPNGNAEDDNVLRPPHGYSESMMLAESEKSDLSDMESLVSFKGIGRGKIDLNGAEPFEKKNGTRGIFPQSAFARPDDGAVCGKRLGSTRGYTEAVVAPDSDDSDFADSESCISALTSVSSKYSALRRIV